MIDDLELGSFKFRVSNIHYPASSNQYPVSIPQGGRYISQTWQKKE